MSDIIDFFKGWLLVILVLKDSLCEMIFLKVDINIGYIKFSSDYTGENVFMLRVS